MKGIVKAMKRILSIFLCFALCICFCSTAFADENLVQPRFSHISSVYCNISKNTLTYKVSCSVISKDPSYTVSFTATLQELSSSWSDTSHVWNVSEVASAGFAKNIFLGSGTYRLKVDITILSSTGAVLETETVYSNQYIL